MTQVRWLCDSAGADRGEEYLLLRESRPDEAAAVRAAINAVLADPDRAARLYSIRLGGRQEFQYAMPYLRAVGMLTCLAWRNVPREDAIIINDFSHVWPDDFAMPDVYPRPDTSR